MSHEKISRKMYDENLRIEKIVYLAGQLGESIAEDAKDLLEDSSVEDLNDIFGTLPQYMIEAIEDGHDEEIASWLIDEGKLGYVVQFASPIRERFGGSKFFSMSWGYYRTKWIYGETIEETIRTGMNWAKSMSDKDMEKKKQSCQAL